MYIVNSLTLYYSVNTKYPHSPTSEPAEEFRPGGLGCALLHEVPTCCQLLQCLTGRPELARLREGLVQRAPQLHAQNMLQSF